MMTNDTGHPPVKDSKFRVGIDVGGIIFMMGLSFNAGIQYSKIATLEAAAQTQDRKVESFADNRLKISERLTHVETLVIDIRDELRGKSGGNGK